LASLCVDGVFSLGSSEKKAGLELPSFIHPDQMDTPLNRPWFPFFAIFSFAWEKCNGDDIFPEVLEAIFTAAPMGFHDTGCGVLNRGSR
jgi:hypothetical protein